MKILIIRFSSIGDIVLTSPVARALKLQKGFEVHYLTKSKFKDLLLHDPHIDKVHAYDGNILELVKSLRTENFDFIIDLHGNIRSFIIKSMLWTKYRTFDKLNFKKWLLVNFKWDIMPDTHIVNRYLATIDHFDVIFDGDGLGFYPDLSVLPKVETYLSLEKLEKGEYIVLVTGAMHFTKRIPFEKMKEMIFLQDYKVVLLGGKDEFAESEKITLDFPGKVMNACGKFNLSGSALIIKYSKFVIASDTGLMHIAAAMQKKIISVWGNTVPAFGMYPFYDKNHADFEVRLEVSDLKCRPCSKIGFESCPKKHFNCMNKINLSTLNK